MKILILGSKGMLGQELAKVFQDLSPVLWDKSEIDITRQKEVQDKISQLKPEIIINAAAYTDVDGAETERELAQQVNGYAVGYLASMASDMGAIFVHYSTDYVFDGQKKAGYQEKDQPKNPLNVYGQSKLLGEKLLQQNCQKYYLIRTSGLFGQHGRNFVETILKSAQEKDELTIVNDQHFKPTYAKDLAQATRDLIETKPSFGIYHLTNEEAITWYNFAKEILKIRAKTRAALGKAKGSPCFGLPQIIPCSSSQFPRPAPRPKYSILLNTKLPPLRPWPDALKEYLKIQALN